MPQPRIITLAELVKREGPLPVTRAVRFVRDGALCLVGSHRLGQIDRQLTPERFGVSEDDMLCLLPADHRKPQLPAPYRAEVPSPLLSAVDYQAPEQTLDLDFTQIQTDVYALGCILFFLLTGREVFSGPTLTKRMMQHHLEPPPDLRALRPDVPADLQAIFCLALEKQPVNRHQHAEALARTLTAWLNAQRKL